MTTLKQKIITAFSLLFGLVLMGIAGAITFSLYGKVVTDIRTTSLNFSELASEAFFDSYELYYVSGSYALFTSDARELMQRNAAVHRMQIVTASGDVLADTAAQPGEALPRMDDADMLLRLSSPVPSTNGSRTVYIYSKDGDPIPALKDADGAAVADFSAAEKITSIVFPLSDAQHRVIYYISYDAVLALVQRSAVLLFVLFIAGFILTLITATFFARGITRPLMLLKDGAEEIAKGNLATRIQIQSKDETKLLADTFNKMAEDLGKALSAKVEQERVQKELEVAREIQTSFLPKSLVVEGLEIAAHFEPAAEVGGDVYDILPAGEDAIIYIGDATGHGTASGIVSALTNAAIATAAHLETSLHKILASANSVICDKTKKNMFITLLALLWKPKTSTLTFVSAGHELPLIYRAEKDRVEQVAGKNGMALGMMKKALTPQEESITLGDADLLLLFTDGLPEAHNPENALLGNEAAKELFLEAARAGGDLESVVRHIIAGLKRFTNGRELLDDVTLLLLRKKR